MISVNGLSMFTDTFTPTVSLVGGSGNTVPQYTTNSGIVIYNQGHAFVSISLKSDGGNEGAGSGKINIQLVDNSKYTLTKLCGTARNGVDEWAIRGVLTAGSNLIALEILNDGFTDSTSSSAKSFTGADQSSTTREINLSFEYEIE